MDILQSAGSGRKVRKQKKAVEIRIQQYKKPKVAPKQPNQQPKQVPLTADAANDVDDSEPTIKTSRHA
ncbi:hypothetical protein LSTR_LSTR001911 [Laodelphax striatellus]|uniref:Uncharacterized protein n=1 Tax=Laodelphax striatellus TaxID=195883 RepID=A0A482XHD8_LAOST|nr:hypothetical protein LSTR_LSTR001911 [Laodelphax striatellus]